MTRLFLSSAALAFVLAACGDGTSAPSDARVDEDAGRVDLDASTLRDGGLDASSDGGLDAGLDAGRADGGTRRDAGTDAGEGDAAVLPFPLVVDATSMDRKVLMGYQGWFSAAGDGSRGASWRHWSRGETPRAGNLTFDAFPDLREYAPEELFPTELLYADGRTVGLFSAYTPATVDRHFRWMREYGIDGVFLQEFVSELAPGSAIREFRDRVAANVRAGAEAHGRALAVMYDVSGADPATLVETIRSHWATLRADGTLESERYLHHEGRPVVAIWGFGFTDRPYGAAQAIALLDWFQRDAPEAERAYVVGGVPAYWRSLDRDSEADPAWAAVYRRFDAISPWTVGRYADDSGVRAFRADRVAPDLAEASRVGAAYMPVAFPGFSWSNLFPGNPLNQIPRRGGRFFWTQVHEWTSAGATTLFVAMFDEVDEGTAMFKIAETRGDAPIEPGFLTLDADGESLPSDFYLRLAGEAGRLVRGERAPSADRPIDPPGPTCSPPDSVPVSGRCVPSCGAAGGNSCDPTACAGRPRLEAYDCEVCCAI